MATSDDASNKIDEIMKNNKVDPNEMDMTEKEKLKQSMKDKPE